MSMILRLFNRGILLERGADVTRKCRRGRMPIQEAPKGSQAAKLLVFSAYPTFMTKVIHLILSCLNKHVKEKTFLMTLFSTIK